MTLRAVTKTGRNEQCPCGSGKKYKKCCLGHKQARTESEAYDKRNTNWRSMQQSQARQAENEKEKALSAAHEAGHCIADELYGPGVEYTTIEPSEGSDLQRPLNNAPGWVGGISTGYTKMRREWMKPEDIDVLSELMCVMAGPLMEDCYARRFYGEAVDRNVSHSELDSFWHIIAGEDAPKELIADYELVAQDQLIRTFRNERVCKVWLEVVNELLAHSRVTGDRVREIINAAGARKFAEEQVEE